MASGFKINPAGIKKLERDIQKKIPGVQVPLDGSEDDAIRSVKDQLKKMGATPNDSNVRKIVREARKG
jgi:hypothetical protein